MTAAAPRPESSIVSAAQFAAAESLAAAARTTAEFGKAVDLVRSARADLTIRDVVARIERYRLPSVSRSTVWRLCDGRALPGRSESVVSVLRACGYRSDPRVWITAWERVRQLERRQRRTAATVGDDGSGDARPDAPLVLGELVSTDPSVYGPAEKVDLAGPDDDVVIQVGIGSWEGGLTRGQLRRAVPALIAAGLVAGGVGDAGSSRAAVVLGGAALAMAVGLALVDMGTQDRVPIPPHAMQRQFQAALDAIDPDIVHGKLDKAVSRARNVCQAWKSCPDRTSYLAAVAKRFSSPRRPNGWDPETVSAIASAIEQFIRPPG